MLHFTLLTKKRKEEYMEPLRILMLAWEYPPMIVGGLGRHVYELSRALTRNGHEVHVITVHDKAQVFYEEIESIHVHRVVRNLYDKNAFYEWVNHLNEEMIAYALDLCERYEFHVVHAHDWLVAKCAIELQQKKCLATVTTIHATEHGRNNGIHTSLQYNIHMKEKELAEASQFIIVCSQFMKDEVVKVLAIQSEKVTVLPNGIDEHFFHEIVPTYKILEDIQCEQRFLIFSIGRIVSEKGFYTIIEVAPHLTFLYPNLLFIIAGKGPMLEQYRSIVKERGLEQHVMFYGYISEEEQRAFLQCCDVLLIPSLYEPFGIVALEGMLAKKPVVVSSVGGLREIITDGVNGFHIEAGCPYSLSHQLTYVIEEYEIACQIACKGYEDVLTYYNWDQIAKSTANVYENVVQHHKMGGEYI